jgi:exonuclease SbcD
LCVTFADDSGAVCVLAIPYADPVETRAALAEDGIHDHQAALHALVTRARGQLPAGARHVLVTHAFVAGSLTSDSERPLSVGGAGQVTADVCVGFDYVALGHLHRPQSLGAGALRYSGSLLKYSFLEADHDKSVTIVDVDPGAPGRAPSIEQVRLAPRHDVRVIGGRLADLLSAGRTDAHNQDYVCARLLDKGAILDPIGQLREVYANVLTIDRSALDLSGERSPASADPGSRSESEHFAAFFAYCTGDELEPAENVALSALLDELEREWRSS